MVVCKICEKDVAADRLGPHSQKCKEFAESKDFLSVIIARMEAYGEQASEMKNALETNATKQKKKQTKKWSTKEFPELSLVSLQKCSIFSDSSPGQTFGSQLAELEQCNSEEDRADHIATTQDTLENIEETPCNGGSRMAEEDYRKFVDEVNKSMRALKKVILYTHNIVDWALETTAVCNFGRHTKSELMEDVKEIVDENVAKFLNQVIADLESYITVREKYLEASQDLLKTSSPDVHSDVKQKFFANRSTSYATFKSGSGLSSKRLLAPKKVEENVGVPVLLKGKESPKVEPAAPINLTNLATIPASPSLKGLKTDFSKMLLQTNLNHVHPVVNHGPMINMRKIPEENSNTNLKDVIKATLHLNLTEKTTAMGENPLLSPIASVMTHKAKDRKPLATNHILSAFGKATSETKAAPAIKETQTPKHTPLKRNAAQSSKNLFKTLRNEDSKGNKGFGFIEEHNKSKFASPRISEPIISINPSQNQKKPEEDPDFVESMRGYYSDCGPSRSRRKNSCQDSDSNHVKYEDFEIIKFIGKGAYGEVYLVKKKATGDLYAMKTVDCSNKETQEKLKDIKAEKDIYQALEGDLVVKAFWTFNHDNMICFVTEYMLGGDLDKLLDRMGRLEEDQARFYFAELVLAVESLHNLKVVHRDLKPDNIMMDAKGHLRLTDFGLSKGAMDKYKSTLAPLQKMAASPKVEQSLFKTRTALSRLSLIPSSTPKARSDKVVFNFLELAEDPQIMDKKPTLTKPKSPVLGAEKKPKMVGTPDYMAPEIIAPDRYDLEGYDEKCMDWWSMGVILYQFLVGVPAFCDTSIEAVFDNIKNLRMEWPPIGDEEDCISFAAADLIRKLLTPDPKKRIGAKGASEVKNHPFFKGVDWATLREREAPIIPTDNSDNEQKTPQQTPKKQPGAATGTGAGATKAPAFLRKNSRAMTAKPIDFGAFKMRRLDLLDEANQQIHKDLQKKTSANNEP